jgi:hypothetical protein
VVVEVVLPRHLGAGEREHATQGVAHGGPADGADVQGAGRVGGDELEVDLLPRERVGGAVRRTGGDHVGRHLALGAGLDGDVEEAGTRDLDVADAVGGPQPLGDQVGEGPRVGALPPDLHRPGQLQRHVGGVVAVTLLPGSLHRDLGRHAVGQRDRAVGHEGTQRIDDGLGELVGVHRTSLSAAPATGRTGFTPWFARRSLAGSGRATVTRESPALGFCA